MYVCMQVPHVELNLDFTINGERIYIYIYIHIHKYIYIYIHIHIYICVCIYIYICKQVPHVELHLDFTINGERIYIYIYVEGYIYIYTLKDIYISINYTGWILIALTTSENLWIVYFTIYSTLALTVVSAIKLSGASFINQTIITNKETTLIEFVTLTSLLSLSVLPPFLGFLRKWIVIT
jgi:hypothetical protein